MSIITDKAIERRSYWVGEIKNLSGNFGDDFTRLYTELKNEIANQGIGVLIDHLRLCGSIPEEYGHDSSEEKLYSKYTDAILALSFQAVGLKSLVITERADAADVEVFAEKYAFVADAKAFRLSRTAKNQKDFKVASMHGWKRDKRYAMVVCPIYQLPRSSSQIYQTASTSNVCVFTYSHLSLLLCYSQVNPEGARALITAILESVETMNPTKSSVDYWTTINRTMVGFAKEVAELWAFEKIAAAESIEIAKKQDLTFLAKQREIIMRMTHEEALGELIKVYKIESKIRAINAVRDNGLFGIV